MKKISLLIIGILLLSSCSLSKVGSDKEPKKKVTTDVSKLVEEKGKSSKIVKGEYKQETSRLEKGISEQNLSETNELESSLMIHDTTKSTNIGPFSFDNAVKADEKTLPNPPMSPEVAKKLLLKTDESDTQVGKKVMLNVAQQYQSVWNWCAPTTVSMMLSARGISVSQAQLANEMKTDNHWGTHNANAIEVLNQHLFGYKKPDNGQAGYRLATVTTSALDSEDMRLFKERIRATIDEGYPIYYTFDSSKIYPGKVGEHNVIGNGYQLTENGKDIAYIYYLDPSSGVSDPVYGGLKKVTPEELLNAMLTCVEPNYAW